MTTSTRRRPGRIPGKPAGMDTYERFLTLVDSTGGPDACHTWTGTLQRAGYGRFTVAGRKVTATRWLLGYLRGRALDPKTEWALHHCDTPLCVNPKHLYIGTPVDNARDMNERRRNSIVIARREATHCRRRGHEYTPENTAIRNDNGARRCKACDHERSLRRRAA